MRTLVGCARFRSHHKDGGHAIPAAIAENRMLQANFMALCFTEPESLDERRLRE